MSFDLTKDLIKAEAEARGETPCGMCAAIESHAGEAHVALRRAAGGTIGVNKLVAILAANEVTDPDTGKAIGRRTIMRHRSEEHTA